MRTESRVWVWAALTVACTFVLGVIDWLTGYEINFFVFYFLPVSMAAWRIGLVASICSALLSALVWIGADILDGHTYSSSFYPVWNTMMRLISFLTIGWSVATLKHSFDHERETAEALRRSLSEIKVLETFLPICAQCKKIRDQQGVWQHLEVYIGQHSNTQFSHGYCPECFRKAMADAGMIDESPERGIKATRKEATA